MYNKSTKKKVIHAIIIVIVFFAILSAIGLYILRYQVKGESNLPFNITKIIIAQSVEGIEKAKIIGVIDHHRIANFRTSDPLYYNARPYGCTCTILYNEYKQRGLEINKEFK